MIKKLIFTLLLVPGIVQAETLTGWTNKTGTGETVQRRFDAGVSPRGPYQVGLETNSYTAAYTVGTDTVDSATTSVITAASHAAKVGDIIRFTDNVPIGVEARVVAVATNTITLGTTLAAAPAASDAFTILTPVTLAASSTGGLTSVADTGQAIDAGGLKSILYAVINVDSASASQVIAAVAGVRFRVLSYAIVCDAATTILFQDDAGSPVLATGAMALAANGGVSASSEFGLFESGTANQDLDILQGSAANCDGHLTYIQVT